MIYSKDKIIKAINDGKLTISPFNINNINSASYSFTLSEQILIPIHKPKPDKLKSKYLDSKIEAEGYSLQPGSLILGYTNETLFLHNHFACILSAHGSVASSGLNVLLNSVYAEPDTQNKILVEILNSTNYPIIIHSGMKLIKGIFFEIV